MTISERIRERRKELGMSADELADKIGKTRSTIYRYETDEVENMPISILEPLAKALNTTAIYLLGLDEEEVYKDEVVQAVQKLDDVNKKFLMEFINKISK